MLLLTSFTSEHTRFDYYTQGQMLRSAYLFGEHLLVAGEGHFEIAIDDHYSNPSAMLKKSTVMLYVEQVPDPAYKVSIEKLYADLKEARKTIKHEPPGMIVARKRIEKMLDTLYDSGLAWLKNLLDQGGFMGLMSLVNDHEISLVGGNPENDKSKEGKGSTYSLMLAQKWRQGEDEVYYFTTPFWDYAAQHPGLMTTVDEMNKDARMLLFRLPNLPKLQSYSPAELKQIKLEVFNSIGDWKTKLENWSLQLLKEDFSANRFEDYARFYAAELKPAMEQLEEKIKASELLQKPQSTRGLQYSENWLAITNARTAWDFMEWGGLVPKESMHIFEQHLPEGCNGDKAMPVFLSKSTINPFAEEDTEDKKSLEL